MSGVAYSDWVREFEAVEGGRQNVEIEDPEEMTAAFDPQVEHVPEPMLWRCLKCGVWVTDRFVHEHVRPVR